MGLETRAEIERRVAEGNWNESEARIALEQRGYYVSDVQLWTRRLNRVRCLPGPAKIHSYENALILPPIRDEKVKAYNGVFLGGVCSDEGEFVAGRFRSLDSDKSNWTCRGSYEPKGEIGFRDERVIFGGITIGHFGHSILDTTARLWGCFNNHTPSDCKIIFIEYPNAFKNPYNYYELFDLLDIADRVEVLRAPMRFSEVLVPEEGIYPLSGDYRDEYIETFDEMRKAVEPSPYKKVYLTRTGYKGNKAFTSGNNCINEEYYEDFYRRRGYHVASPEALSTKEQIALVAGAEEIVSSIGTMTHLLLFAREDTKVTIMSRSSDFVMAQSTVDAARHLKPMYFEAVRDPLPSKHTSGPHLFYPNRFFKRSLEASHIPFKECELVCSVPYEQLALEFMKEWALVYREERKSRELRNSSSSAYLRRVYESLFDDDIQEGSYSAANGIAQHNAEIKKQKDKVKQLNAQVKQLKKQASKASVENVSLRKRIRQLENSRSWKVTKPLRDISRLFISR